MATKSDSTMNYEFEIRELIAAWTVFQEDQEIRELELAKQPK